MSVKTVLVVGCSMTSGYNLGGGKNGISQDDPLHPDIWCNTLFQSSDEFAVVNRSSSGANNETIFQIALEGILSEKFDLILIQWTLINRINLQSGLELYHTRSMLQNSFDVNLNNNFVVSGKWLDDLGDRLRWVSNPHWKLLDLVRYVNVLKHLQNFLHGSKILFVNGSLELPKNYFARMSYRYPNELPEYVQDMLQVQTRNDIEIAQLYEMIHTQYANNQGIQPESWLNLYEPLREMQVDSIDKDDNHPGPNSQIIFADFLKEKLREKIT